MSLIMKVRGFSSQAFAAGGEGYFITTVPVLIGVYFAAVRSVLTNIPSRAV